MNLPNKIRTSIKCVEVDGTPCKEAAIYKDYILCHPDMLDTVKEGFKLFWKVDLEYEDKSG